MASKSITIQSRDRTLLTDLLQTPLDAEQIRRLSQTYCNPFNDVELVRRRLRDAGFVVDHTYQTESAGQLKYYKLAREGYRLVCGQDKALPSQRYFNPVSPSLQRHTRRLADFLVKTREAGETT